ncbi:MULTISPECIES: glycosyl hydrolase 108 family protein [Serratia]|uniref:glycosyl hydrolase 108 family protein n=1 Tax=Serratia TaxID=613 RepID=UPI0006605453|nr:glycosyl hydrolase 108 family protein [Serratia sp. 506_PEND]
METRYPIRQANGKNFDSQEEILTLLRQEKHGRWLSGSNDMWHGGIHISRNTAPWSVLTPDTGDDAVPLQCIASGELVAWRVCQDYVMGNLGDKPLQYSPSFLLVRSVHKPATDASTWLCFYTLYMHLTPLSCYPKWTVYQVTPKGNGLIMRQYSGSEVSGQTVPPEVSHKARLHSGEQVLIERQETFLLHNGQAEVFGLAQRLKDGAPVGDKFWTSARPAYVEPIGEQYGYLPGWMAVALNKGQFDTVVCPSVMTAIKAGDAIGFLGKEEVPDEFSNVTADWFSHIEVLSNDGRMPLFLNNPGQLHTGRQFLLVPEGKQLYQCEEKGSSHTFEPVGLTNRGDAADIIPAESAKSATDSASVVYLQIRPGTWIRKDDVETVSQNDLAKLKFKAVGQEPLRNQLRSLETQWVIDAFRWLGSQLWAGRDLESGQLQVYYTRMADELEKVNTPENIQNENRDSVSDMLRHRNQYVDFFLRRLVVKHESEWHGGSKNPKWNGVLATMTGESLAYVQQWLDAHEWMSQVPEFSKDEAVWHFHPVEFLTAICEPVNRCRELFAKISPIILKHEGGYVDDPDDKGGETNMGITFSTWKSFAFSDLGIHPSSQSLKAMTKEQAEVIYYKHYWEPRGFCKLENTKVALMIYDWTITSRWAIREVRKLISTEYDSKLQVSNVMDDSMVHCINSISDQNSFLHHLANVRKSYYRSLTVTDGIQNTQTKFLNGWLGRVDDCLQADV